jgi:hypothetical protein
MGANASTAVPLYASGQVLDAARLNLTNSGIPVFSGTATRDAAFGGSGEKVLAEGQFAYLEDTNSVQYYDSTAWQSVGTQKIAQVVSATSSTNTTTTSTSYVTSGLSASITPSLSSSKVMIFVSGVFYNNAANAEIYATVFRGTVAGTNLATTANTGFATVFPAVVGNGSFTFLDSPNTTSAQTYTVGIRSAGGSATASWAYQSGTTVITLMEVLA